MTSPQKIICLMGPTASGKTQLAINLAQHFPLEIISVDSALVYRGMDIGTAKPSFELLKLAPHRLTDIRDPSESYSAAQFLDDATKEITAIHQSGKIPLLVGGTMLYFRALQKGLAVLPSADAATRAAITEAAAKDGWPAQHNRLTQVDPAAAKRIHPHDSQRIQRALEVYDLTGTSLSHWQDTPAAANNYEILNLAIAPLDRKVLHARIAQRFEQMLAAGFVDEVKKLYDRDDLNLELPAMRSVGYRQVWEYLAGQSTFEEMQEKAIIATRQLAKRQLTWLRHWPQEINWFDSLDEDAFAKTESTVKQFLKAGPP
jgi:tRNA dimethylallyltransferase